MIKKISKWWRTGNNGFYLNTLFLIILACLIIPWLLLGFANYMIWITTVVG